ncbi:MAG: DnaK suppressor protein [Pseudohongiellaceae bacterium]|jgi:DnaK suppressor protein
MKLQDVETKLRKKLAELEERLAHIKKNMSKSHSADSAEQATERENDEVLEEIGLETQSSIQEIRAALSRIDAGVYGSCASCGEAISPGRLDALPEATHCVACAEG